MFSDIKDLNPVLVAMSISATKLMAKIRLTKASLRKVESRQLKARTSESTQNLEIRNRPLT